MEQVWTSQTQYHIEETACCCQSFGAPFLDVVLTPAIILITAGIAWFAQKSILARRATWDFVTEHEQPSEWMAVASKAKKYLNVRKECSDWAEFAERWSSSSPTTKDRKIEQCVLYWANRREFVAICILNGTLHKKMYAKWWGYEFISEWNRFSVFLEALMRLPRADADLYENFEKLATDRRFQKYANWPKTESIPRLRGQRDEVGRRQPVNTP